MLSGEAMDGRKENKRQESPTYREEAVRTRRYVLATIAFLCPALPPAARKAGGAGIPCSCRCNTQRRMPLPGIEIGNRPSHSRFEACVLCVPRVSVVNLLTVLAKAGPARN